MLCLEVSFYCHYANYMCILPGVMQDICVYFRALCKKYVCILLKRLGKLYTIQCTLYTVQRTLYSVHYTLYSVHYTVYAIHCTAYTIHGTLYTIHCTLCTVQTTVHYTYALYSVHYLLYHTWLVRQFFGKKCVKCFNIFSCDKVQLSAPTLAFRGFRKPMKKLL